MPTDDDKKKFHTFNDAANPVSKNKNLTKDSVYTTKKKKQLVDKVTDKKPAPKK